MITTEKIPKSLAPTNAAPRAFEFERDTFAFANELLWEYRFDSASGRTHFSRREPRSHYTHRCFVLTRAARQFLYHARFAPELPPLADARAYAEKICEVMTRNPRVPCRHGQEIVFPGHASLREFSRAQESLLKANCGGAWQSYVLRSHWRMTFPISRAHQVRTAENLFAAIQQKASPIIHLVLFPKLSINHGMILFGAAPTETGFLFQAYDPNDPEKPTAVKFDRTQRTFFLPANRYWAGGELNVIEIYHKWFM